MTTFSPSTVGSVATRMSSMRPTAERRERDAAVLRLAALGDVELREHLQARRDAGGHLLRDALHLAEHAVDAEADDERVLLRLEVDVGGVLLGGLEDQRVDEPDERPVGDAVVGLEVVAVRLVDGLVHVDGDDGADRLGGAHEPLELGEDVVARRDAELERVLRREPELVDRVQVPRVGDRDLEHVVLDRVRDRDGALERLHGDQLRGVDGDADGREVDDREVVAHGEHARDPVGGRDALVDERLRDRRAARRCARERAPARPAATSAVCLERDRAGARRCRRRRTASRASEPGRGGASVRRRARRRSVRVVSFMAAPSKGLSAAA